MVKKLEIFKPGSHIAMNGETISFSEADLIASAAAYDPAKHEAPMVIGHPRQDGPAYGWAKSMEFSEGVARIEPDQVDAAFAEMVNSGKFKKISASFYLPTAPNNPVPGVYYLRHVGFLGAQPPAVKGLKSASFAEGEEGIVEFGDWADRVEAGVFRKLREWIIGKFGLDEADKALPGWDVDIIQEEANKEAQCEPEPAAMPAFSEKEIKPMITPEQIAAKEAEFAERDKALKTRETAGLHTENLSFAEGLVKEGKLLPALKEQAVAMLDFAAGLEAGQIVEFGEGDGKKSLPLAESFKTFLSGQPKIVDFGETAGIEQEKGTVNFSTPPGYTVDAAGLELHTKALSYQQKNPGADYMTAVKACQ